MALTILSRPTMSNMPVRREGSSTALVVPWMNATTKMCQACNISRSYSIRANSAPAVARLNVCAKSMTRWREKRSAMYPAIGETKGLGILLKTQSSISWEADEPVTSRISRLITSSSFRLPNSANMPTDHMRRKFRSLSSPIAVPRIPGMGLIHAPKPRVAAPRCSESRRKSKYSNFHGIA